MLITDEIWSDEWFCSLEQRQKLLYIYLLGTCSKCGIFELNMRKINFDLTNGSERVKPYSANEVLTFAGNRIQKVNDSKAIIVKYIQFNWVRDKPLNPEGNPLHRGLANELAKYGLTFDKLNEMAGRDSIPVECDTEDVEMSNEEQESAKSGPTPKDLDAMFNAFWDRYPKCMRKIDKKKCRDKLVKILTKADDAVQMFNKIMNGLDEWRQSSMWNKDGGQFICAPLVWLNGERWEDNPEKGNGNGYSRINNTANANHKIANEESIGW